MAGWTADEDAKLRQLHANGLTPIGMVDYFPGRTKNSIIARLNRLDLRTRETYLQDMVSASSETHDLILRLRCKWRWPASSIAQALALKLPAVNSVIYRYTDPASENRRSEAA